MEMKDILKQHTDAVEQQLGALDQKTRDAVASVIEAKARMDELEQKMASVREGGTPATKSLGQLLTENTDAIEQFAQKTSSKGTLALETKTTITSDAASGGALYAPTRDAMTPIARRPLRVRDLLPSVRATTGTVEYPAQTARTNNAAPVAEGNVKPESALAYEMQTVPIRTIAHWVPASRQILSDVPQLQDIIDGELRYGLYLKEDEQLLNGDGTGQNLSGLVTEATAFAPDFTVAAATMLDVLGLAFLQGTNADYPSDGVVMNPADWMKIRLMKNADGEYIMGPPGSDVAPQVFGLPVAQSASMPSGQFLVGNFALAATLYDREQARLLISDEHDDFFVRNLIALLVEERIGLAVKQPTALITGAFDAAVTASTSA